MIGGTIDFNHNFVKNEITFGYDNLSQFYWHMLGNDENQITLYKRQKAVQNTKDKNGSKILEQSDSH